MFWALCLLFICVIQRPAAHRRRSSPSKNVFLWKVFPGCVTGRPHSTTQPSGQCSNLSCPQRVGPKKKKKEKTEIARADPTGHVNLSRLQHRNNRLYLQVALKIVCAHSFTCLRNIVCINMLTRSGTNYSSATCRTCVVASLALHAHVTALIC